VNTVTGFACCCTSELAAVQIDHQNVAVCQLAGVNHVLGQPAEPDGPRRLVAPLIVCASGCTYRNGYCSYHCRYASLHGRHRCLPNQLIERTQQGLCHLKHFRGDPHRFWWPDSQPIIVGNLNWLDKLKAQFAVLMLVQNAMRFWYMLRTRSDKNLGLLWAL